ncbi:MAG TPA: PilN domain-containing protein [Polyangiaceae bacterium]|jgi:type IV pilus assembly protein PilN|nr:PilN domain-containing protein [Polyangiaceae bacterium]
MVRINLLPDRKQTARRSGAAEPKQVWLFAVMGAVLATIVVCLFVQKVKENELSAILADNSGTQGQIDAIGKQIADHAQITSRLKELRDREDAIQKLQSARSGPTSTLLELSHLLTVGGNGPTTDRDKIEQMKRDNPSEVYNANWDPRRLWLTTYKEESHVVKMGGLARDGEDVSELERRLKLSDYFTEVKLLPGSKITDAQTHQELFQFQLSARVRY